MIISHQRLKRLVPSPIDQEWPMLLAMNNSRSTLINCLYLMAFDGQSPTFTHYLWWNRRWLMGKLISQSWRHHRITTACPAKWQQSGGWLGSAATWRWITNSAFQVTGCFIPTRGQQPTSIPSSCRRYLLQPAKLWDIAMLVAFLVDLLLEINKPVIWFFGATLW